MGNPIKNEIRAGAVHEVGAKLDDLLEGANVRLHQTEGKIIGAQIIAKRIADLLPHVDADVLEGKYGLETAKDIKTYLMRAQTMAEVTNKQAADERMQALGAVSALKVSVEVTQKMYDREQEAARAEPETDSPRSLKEIRLAEAASSEAPGVEDS